MHTHDMPTLDALPANAPAVRIRLTVSSGFYVRSFAYDLGTVCCSYGTMAALVRSKQGEFTNIDPPPKDFVPALTHKDLESGENVWGPKITKVLGEWMQSHPPVSTENRLDDRDRPGRDYGYNRSNYGGTYKGAGQKRSWDDRKNRKDLRQAERHNSSSPES